MSDSDDTELLLLISPNYYLNTAEKLLAQDEQSPQRKSLHSSDHTNDSKSSESLQRIHDFQSPNGMNADANESFLTLNGLTSTMDDINLYLYRKQAPPVNFDNTSDLSTTSSGITGTNTVNFNASNNSQMKGNESCNFVHSTPKASNRNINCNSSSIRNNYADQDPVTLLEIDKFLSLDRANVSIQSHLSNDPFNCTNHGRSLPYHQNNDFLPQSCPVNQQNSNYVNTMLNAKQQLMENDNLISLSEIWGENAQLATVPLSTPATTIKEEQLRRQHLEKIVQQLLNRQIEYQQRLSVAIEVDKTKDSVLKNLQLQNTSLRDELEQQRERLQDLQTQHRHFNDNMELMRKELLRMNALNTKYEEKNEKLQQELNDCNRKSADSDQKYRQQIEDLELQIHACKRSEELAISDMHKNKDKFITSEHLLEKMKTRCQTLEKENEALQHQKQTLQQLHQKQKTRSDGLEAQKKSLQDNVDRLTELESSLRKKMDVQQKTLKSQYQHQLEQVVAQKLKEFQEQLDKTEETFKLEARDRERWIVDRAIKQLQQINEKNELELSLLQAKSNEEIQLYRLQLANATKKIEDLEVKVNTYKTKRADIAEKLHNVMETQWRKALEILTAPAHQSDYANVSGESMTTTTNPSPTSITKEMTTKTLAKANSESSLNHKASCMQLSTVDKLQAYIEALLSKAPSDFDKLDELLALNAKAKLAKEKLDKSARKQNHGKPPWKA